MGEQVEKVDPFGGMKEKNPGRPSPEPLPDHIAGDDGKANVDARQLLAAGLQQGVPFQAQALIRPRFALGARKGRHVAPRWDPRGG